MRSFVPSPRTLAFFASFAALLACSPAATAEAPAKPAELGKVRFSPGNGCRETSLPVSQCRRATVSCPGVADIDVLIKVSDPAGAPKGTILFGAGGGGEPWWEQAYAPMGAEKTLEPLRKAGYRIIQKSWQGGQGGWFRGPGGMRALSCRYATLADAIAREMKVGPAFCAAGGSGGASEVAHALATYGLGKIFDAALMSAGPVTTRIDHGCLAEKSPGWEKLCREHRTNTVGLCAYTGIEPPMIDMTYGPSTHACSAHDASFAERWKADSLLAPGAILDYPKTELRFVFGTADGSVAAPMGQLFASAVTSKKKVTVLREAPHTLGGTPAGAEQIAKDLLESCVPAR